MSNTAKGKSPSETKKEQLEKERAAQSVELNKNELEKDTGEVEKDAEAFFFALDNVVEKSGTGDGDIESLKFLKAKQLIVTEGDISQMVEDAACGGERTSAAVNFSSVPRKFSSGLSECAL